MNNKANILIVDDEQIVRESLLHWFEEEDYNVDVAEDGESALKKFVKGKYDIYLVDIKMPGISGLDLLTKIKEYDNDACVIMITAFASVPTAIKALKDGATDYITKPIDPDELTHLIEKIISQKKLKQENIQLKENLFEIIKPENLIGESDEIKKIYSLINTVSQTDTTVMIRGESGTGKELVARAIHINSKRKYFPIVTVNCGALAESILESELFGHEKGAFTGAHYKRKGKFEMANGGTIFLDEIGTISQKVQVELLRVIESKQFVRVGGNETIKSDFRVIAATNEPLEELVKKGAFREDLYYRLNVFTIFIPPLRERQSDIQVLAYFFLKKFATAMNKKISKISNEAMEFLKLHNWPGNVRELENAIERAVVVSQSDTIELVDLPFQPKVKQFDCDDKTIDSLEKKYITAVLTETNWNKTKTAQILGVNRVTLYNKLKKYGLHK